MGAGSPSLAQMSRIISATHPSQSRTRRKACLVAAFTSWSSTCRAASMGSPYTVARKARPSADTCTSNRQKSLCSVSERKINSLSQSTRSDSGAVGNQRDLVLIAHRHVLAIGHDDVEEPGCGGAEEVVKVRPVDSQAKVRRMIEGLRFSHLSGPSFEKSAGTPLSDACGLI